MNEIRLYGKNRKHPRRGARSYWTDIEAWKRSRKKATGRFPPTVNVTSQTRAWSRGLSPILIGPVDTYAENGRMLQAVSVEVAWQYSKVYSHELTGGKLTPLAFQDAAGMPNPSWFAWRDRAWTNPEFHWNHPDFKKNKRLVRRAYPKGSLVAGWYWDGRMMDAVTARREIYAALYCRHVVQTPAFQQLQALCAKGDVAIFDMDGYDAPVLGMSPDDTIRDTGHSWGHGMLLTLMLQGVDPTTLGRNPPQSNLATTPPINTTFISTKPHSKSNTYMNITEELAAAEARVTQLKTLAGTKAKVEVVLKDAGFDSFEAFLKAIGAGVERKVPAKEKAPKEKKRKRVTITAELAAEMKVLRQVEKLSQEKTAKKLGVSLSSVVNWEKKKFVFPKK